MVEYLLIGTGKEMVTLPHAFYAHFKELDILVDAVTTVSTIDAMFDPR